MKLTKKVLSLVLALVMVLTMGTVAFAARVEADVLDGTEQIQWRLSAQVFTPETMDGVNEAIALDTENTAGVSITTTKVKLQRADVTAYKEVQADLPYTQAGNSTPIVVNPGDMIWVTTHINTNESLYPTVLTQHWFYDTNMFTTTTMNMNQATFVYEESEMMIQAGGSISGSPWSRLTAKNRDAMMNAAVGLTEAQKASHHLYHMVYLMDYDVMDGDYGGEIYNNIDQDLWAVPVYVRPDATPGSTGTILMAETTQLLCEDGEGDYYETGFAIPASAHDYEGQVLTFKVAGGEAEVDYSALEAAITKYEGKTASDYTAATWADATTAYNAAVAARESTDQAAVTAAAEALETAIAALKEKVVLNYANWDAAVAAVPADLSGYTTSSVTTFNADKTAAYAAKDAAVAAESQTALDAAATDLVTATAKLTVKANFADLNTAISDGLAEDTTDWTEASKQALADAIAAAQLFDQDNTPYTQQAEVKAAADAIYDAIENKQIVVPEWEPNLTNWNAALAAIPSDLSGYTTSSVAAYTEGKDAAFAAKDAAITAENQTALDKAASDLLAAIGALEEKIDVTALQAKVNAINAKNYNEDLYPEDAVIALNNALAEAEEIIANKDDIADQSVVTDAIAAIEAADADMIMLDADYTAVTNAIATIPADLSSYTDDTVNAVNNARNAVVYGLKADQQSVVNGYATAINNAVAALAKKPADKAALIAAINSVADYNADDYTDATWADVVTAKAAAEAVRDNNNLTVDDKATVDAATKALTDALAALEEKPKAANKVELKNAIDEAKGKNLDLYTAGTVATLQAALDEANALYNNDALTENDQATIDAAINVLKSAIAGLELKPTEGRVQEVVATDVPFETNKFQIKVDGRPIKVRFTSYTDTASTITFNRAAARNIGEIVSYNAAGEVVSDLSRDIAYEIWTLNFTLYPEAYYVSAKGNDGWESLDLAYVLDYKFSTDDAAVKSVEVAETAKAHVEVPVTVVTGADVLKVRVLVDGQVNLTFNNAVEADGEKTFNAFVKFLSLGDHTVSIEIKTASGWQAVSGFDKVVTVSK